MRDRLYCVGMSPDSVDEVIFGHVLQAGQGQITARQAAVKAGIPMTVPAVTINKVCLSGMTAIQEAANHIRLGQSTFVVAGGMESMTRAPYYLRKGRDGLRLGHGKLLDSMVSDGLWDPYGDKHMGNCAETCVREYKFSREEQDAFALLSHQQAAAAWAEFWGTSPRPSILQISMTFWSLVNNSSGMIL